MISRWNRSGQCRSGASTRNDSEITRLAIGTRLCNRRARAKRLLQGRNRVKSTKRVQARVLLERVERVNTKEVQGVSHSVGVGGTNGIPLARDAPPKVVIMTMRRMHKGWGALALSSEGFFGSRARSSGCRPNTTASASSGRCTLLKHRIYFQPVSSERRRETIVNTT